MVDSNPKMIAVANIQLKKNASFSVIAGALFVALGFFMGLSSGRPTAVIFGGLGLLFIFKGITGYARSSKYPSSEAEGKLGDAG